MTDDASSAMRRASDLVRAGNPIAATEMIQAALRGTAASAMSRPGPVPETLRAAEDVAPFGKGRGLRKTLAELAARARPGGGVGGAPAPEPVLPRGARFDHGSFTCPAGERAYRLYIPDLRARRPAGLVMMLTILAALKLPVEGAALLLAVDRPLDMLRTMTNVWSDSCGAAIIARTEGEVGPAEAGAA